jgi:hypothetical protein
MKIRIITGHNGGIFFLKQNWDYSIKNGANFGKVIGIEEIFWF